MGNRAIITTEDSDGLGIYLHWNGGRDSVNAFLTYCKLKGYRAPEKDSYGWAYLCRTIANFFGNGLSIGIDKFSSLPCAFDNGVYIIKEWEIIDRKDAPRVEQNNYPLKEMLYEINKAQPEEVRLSAEVIEKYCEELQCKEGVQNPGNEISQVF